MNYNSLLLEAETYLYGDEVNIEKAKDCLLKFLEQTNNLYSKEKQIFSFNNSLEYLLFFNRTKYKKEHVFVSIYYHRAHRLLGKVYLKEGNISEAKQEYIKALEYNPMDMRTHFYVADLERIKGDYVSFQKYNNYLYQEIYEPKALAKFYRNLGLCYEHQQKLDLAYSLFEYSLNFDFHDEAKKKISEISKKIPMPFSHQEAINLLKQNNIPLSISTRNLQLLQGIYGNQQINDVTMKSLVGQYLAYFDPNYQRLLKKITIKNPEANFSVQVTSEWAMIDPSQYEKLKIDSQTRYYFYFDDTKINIMDLGTTSVEQVYQQNKDYFVNKNMQILKEGTAVKNRREIQFIFLKCDTNYIFETYFQVGNHVIGASTLLSHGFFMNDKNVKRLWNIISTIKEC